MAQDYLPLIVELILLAPLASPLKKTVTPIHLLNKLLLMDTCNGPGTAVGTEDVINNNTDPNPCSPCLEVTENKQDTEVKDMV